MIISLFVPEAGIEPARPCGHRILNPARLPIPPLGLKWTANIKCFFVKHIGYFKKVIGKVCYFFILVILLKKTNAQLILS